MLPLPSIPSVPCGGGILGSLVYRGGVRKKPGPSVPWDPTTPGNLVLWLKSDTDTFQDSALTTAATVDTNPVGGWKDQGGANNHVLQATAGRRPLLKLAQVNSLPSVRFDGSDDFLQALFTLDAPFDVFLVMNQITWAADVSVVSGGALDNFTLFQHASSPNLYIYGGGSLGGANSGLSTATWGLVEAGVPLAAPNMYIKVNNASATTGAAALSAARGGITLGAHPNPSSYSNIELAEVIVYSTILGAGDQTSLRAYCTARYGFP